MIKQSDSNNSLKEKKYKILSYSILLKNSENLEEDKKELEQTAEYLEKINEAQYEELLAAKNYTTQTLPEEKSRLEDLINLISKRKKERENFLNEYLKVTTSYLDNLEEIKDLDALDYYEDRLRNIDEYLENIKTIEEYKEILEKLNQELKDKYENKTNSELINKKLESSLVEEFTKVICDDEYYTSLNYVDIDPSLTKLENSILEKKSTLDTFVSSYEALERAGISGSEKDEYKQYVKEVSEDYYTDAEKKYMLNIYKLVLSTENDYQKIYNKREDILNVLEERENLRNKLEIQKEDSLKQFIDMCNEQFGIIKSQKYIMDDIDKLLLDIDKYEKMLSTLEEKNNKEEIKEIINEFKLEKEETLIVKPVKFNQIIDVSNPDKMNLDEVMVVAKLVMKKVVMALEPKKFTRKKTAKELASKKEEPVKEENFVKEEDIFNEEKPFEDTNDKVINESNEKTETLFKDESIDVKVDTPFIETKELDSKEEDIFDNTEPFVNDNINNNNNTNEEEHLSNMPIIDKIGSVKPTTTLSKIEELSNNKDNIVLPTMGLTDNDKTEVAISSNEYLTKEETTN